MLHQRPYAIRILRTATGDRLQNLVDGWEEATEDTPGAIFRNGGWIILNKLWKDIPIVELGSDVVPRNIMEWVAAGLVVIALAQMVFIWTVLLPQVIREWWNSCVDLRGISLSGIIRLTFCRGA